MSEIREKVAPIRSAGPVERVAFVPERGPQRPRRVKRGSTPERKFLSMNPAAPYFHGGWDIPPTRGGAHRRVRPRIPVFPPGPTHVAAAWSIRGRSGPLNRPSNNSMQRTALLATADAEGSALRNQCTT